MRARALAPLAALALAAAAAGCRAASSPPAETPAHPTLALMTSLPLYWGEADDMSGLLSGQAEPGWARETLERRFTLEPVDTLEPERLAGVAFLLLAQPRPLAPAENAALDAWVRGGGRLLLLADPMLTAHSRFPVGDRRRPQDVALLSPILRHWGLELTLDDDEHPGVQVRDVGGMVVPVAVAGRFRLLAGGKCVLSGEGVLATCPIGEGRAVIWADAAVLDANLDGEAAGRAVALDFLLDRAFN